MPQELALQRSVGTLPLETRACGQQTGSICLHHQPERPYKPIGYWSGSVIDAERARDTMHKECLAMGWAVLLLRPYLEGP